MYKFKFYYKDGTTDFNSTGTTTPEELYIDFDGLIDWDEYYSFAKLKPSSHEVLEVATRAYKGFLKDFNRIEIINEETGKIIDYIEEGTLISENKKRKKLIEKMKKETEEFESQKYPNNLVYCFKFYKKNGQTKLSSIHAVKPSSLINSFENKMEYKEYEKLIEEPPSTKKILQIAFKIFNKNKEYSRIEIINEETGEIIDFIESTTKRSS